LDDISTRGRLSESLRSRQLLLLGAGAVGSALAELLVRGGVQRLTIMDDDGLEAGNLARHTLSLDEVKCEKAGALREWLNKLTPFASVRAVHSNFPPSAESDRLLVQECEIVVDCTAVDEVLHHLESFPWEEPKLFFSVSLGREARRLFVFAARGEKFPHSRFNELVGPWLRKEMDEYSGEEWPSEGMGCWHPVFPARVDDVRMLVSVALKQIESAADEPPAEPQLVVFEQQYENDRLTGVRQVRA
jgi:molybdopterin/thiamine biosynthesis adenylyltransferase